MKVQYKLTRHKFLNKEINYRVEEVKTLYIIEYVKVPCIKFNVKLSGKRYVNGEYTGEWVQYL